MISKFFIKHNDSNRKQAQGLKKENLIALVINLQNDRDKLM